MMLIESFAPDPDAAESHKIEIATSCEVVYRTLWTTDLGNSPVVKGLLALRSLPKFVLALGRRRASQKITLQTLIDAGFGRLAEDPGREIVLGVVGRFWQPVGAILPFNQENFLGPVPPGLARGVWNFKVDEANAGRTVLSTETRVVCGDESSKLKFRIYWLVVWPFSGLIRLIMLREVRRASERSPSQSQY
jgi:hypothetical protein